MFGQLLVPAAPMFRQPLDLAERFPIGLECYKMSDFRGWPDRKNICKNASCVT
jgi:hypothetical protein